MLDWTFRHASVAGLGYFLIQLLCFLYEDIITFLLKTQKSKNNEKTGSLPPSAFQQFI